MTVVDGVSVLLVSSLALGSSLVFVFSLSLDDVLDDFLRVVIVVGEYRFEMV